MKSLLNTHNRRFDVLARMGLALMLSMTLALTGCDNTKDPAKTGTPATSQGKKVPDGTGKTDGGKTDAGKTDAGASKTDADLTGPLTLYCGRKLSFAQPIVDAFTKKTGIEVKIRDSSSSKLVLQMAEEGDKTPADIFWAQDSGSLGSVAKSGLFAKLPSEIMEMIPQQYRTESGLWIGASGRARVLAYAPKRVKKEDLPKSIMDLTDPKWKGRIGWAPLNGSFQAFVTAMRIKLGEDKTKQWLLAMKNEPKAYPKNTPIIKALADGEIDLGLPNHYYLLRFKATDADYPVEQTFFADGDIGNLVNMAGVGIVKHTKHRAAAEAFVKFLLSDEAQKVFTNTVFEYPLVASVKPNDRLVPQDKLQKVLPDMNLSELNDLAGTLKLLKETGLDQ